jgi:small subunit ribosomal protein S2
MQNMDQNNAVISKEDEAEAKELEGMFKAGVHFGYSRSRRHPKMEKYLFGIRNNVEVFDLSKVKAKLDEASEFMKKMGAEHKMAVFVGTKPDISDIIEKIAREIEMPYTKNRWLGGLISNFPAMRKRMDYFENLKQQQASGELSKYTKKERLEIERDIAKLAKNFSGFTPLKKLPDVMIAVDPEAEKIAVKEAIDKNIPVIGIANSDSNPELVTYIIPANDSSRTSVEHILIKLAKAYKEGVASTIKN